MRTATGLGLLAVGAILAFAINANIPGFNLAAAGWIVMLTGVAGLLLPGGRASGWLRRRVQLRGPQPTLRDPQPALRDPQPAAPRAIEQAPTAARFSRNPAAVAAQILKDAQVVTPEQAEAQYEGAQHEGTQHEAGAQYVEAQYEEDPESDVTLQEL